MIEVITVFGMLVVGMLLIFSVIYYFKLPAPTSPKKVCRDEQGRMKKNARLMMLSLILLWLCYFITWLVAYSNFFERIWSFILNLL